MKLNILFLSTIMIVNAKIITFSELNSMPTSIEKDYYIWKFLRQQNITQKEIQRIIKQVKYKSLKIQEIYKQRTGKNLLSSRSKYAATKKYKIAKKKVPIKQILKSKKPFQGWLKLNDREKIYLFNNINKNDRKLLDKPITRKLWQKLVMYPSFCKSINKIINENLQNLEQAFAYLLQDGHNLDYESLMRLAFYALKNNNSKVAMHYLDFAKDKIQDRESLDQVLFWKYLLSKRKKYLKEILKSHDINIYTLLTRDFLDKEYPDYPTVNLPKKKLTKDISITSPIYWAKLKKKIFSRNTDLKELAKKYRSSETVGFYTYIKSQESKYKKHYFPMPYRDLLSKLPKTRQAIIYAIARQESRFVPSSISRSYALGMMQIMPFLVDHLAKKRNERIDYDDMFNPRKSLIYANDHINYLEKWLQHPLFIAYAYNAGIGFTKRMLHKGDLFVDSRGYEPYLSLEKLPNKQANIYGKHVLTNYVIYMNKLGENIRMIDLLSTLHMSAKTDKFRK